MKVSSAAPSFVEFAREEIERSIPERFERLAAKLPTELAVKSAGRALTYDELNRAANRLARAMLARRGPDEEPVALLFDQGAAAIVAIVGALKAGKIYVPLDPLHFPPAKLAAMLEDSGAGLIVTDGQNLGLAERLADGAREVIDLDRLDPAANAENPGLPLAADRLAYILYTSGSTGEPKGVMQSHRNVLHFIRNYTNDLGVGPEDRQSLLYSCSVAASVKNIFGALLNGAALVSLNLKAEGPARLPVWLVEEGITLGQMVPTVFRHFAERLTGREAFPSLRVLYLGGEPLFRRDVELYKAHFPTTCVLVNALASTELNTLRQLFITHETDIADAVVPVGYRVEDTEIPLLDESGAAVGSDCVGEIAIRSRYLAVGYWRKPELTELAFAADTEGTDKRIYRTADLGRMRSDGCLECLGRKDFQVKIRGHRVEIGEIEAALLALADVQEVVVVALNESAGGKRLAAYIVPARIPAPDAAELRRTLAEGLPDYMIPRSFVFLDSIPLTRSGKVDRSTLPSPNDDSRPVTPRIETVESRVTEIWESLLGVHPIAVDDNFFDIGGDSLTAVDLMRRIEHTFGERLPLSTFLGGPTIRDMAAALVRQRTAPDRSLLVKVQPGEGKSPFFFLHGDFFNGGGFYTINMARYIGADRPFYALAPHGLNGTAVPPTVEAMADEYIAMMRSVQPHGPYSIGGFCSGGSVAYEIARRLKSQGERVPLVVVIAIPARTAFYHRALRAIGGAGSIIGLDVKQRVNVLLRARDAGLKIRRLYRRVRGAQPSPRINRMAPQNDPAFIAYGRTLSIYLPKPYRGRVLCLWPEQDSYRNGGATAGWGRIASDLQFQLIPGKHGNCIKFHLQTIAEHMRRAILKAEGDIASPGTT